VRLGIAWIEASDHVNPLADLEHVLEIGAGAETACRVEDVGGDAVGPRGVVTVETQRPFLLAGFTFAEPVDVVFLGFALEAKDVGSDPGLDGEAVFAGGLTEM